MVVKPDWDIFKANFSENPQRNFEWLCYLLFCREFNKPTGIFRYCNHPTLETEPIEFNNEIIGFQAKFYSVKLTERKTEIKKLINETKVKYPNLTKLYFYSNQDWTFSPISDKRKTSIQIGLEEAAIKNGFKIEWKTKSFFESPFVTIDNADITYGFFDTSTNKYYEKIRTIQKQEIEINDEEIYTTSLCVKNEINPIFEKKALGNFILKQLQENDLNEFSNIFIRGVAGIGKTTEMKLAYNALLETCSNIDSYHQLRFLPIPYFYELKNYQEGFFAIYENEKPLLFLDGLDEIPNSKILLFIKELENLKSQNSSIRFIISGRASSFFSEIKKIPHIDIKLGFYVDSDLQNLIYKFKGSPLESLVTIPFYRNFISTQEFSKITTYSDFITALILSSLKNDKKRIERGENITTRQRDVKKINLDAIQRDLARFSYKLFKSGKRVFSESEVRNFFIDDETFFFIITSSLFDYKSEENISFLSNIYFEYFIAKYYLATSFSLVKKELFLSTGTVIVHCVNIICLLLNLLTEKDVLYKKISAKLNCKSIAYILLTDFTLLPPQKRYDFYKKIIDEYNRNSKLIYYARFVDSHDLLKNVDSLSDLMHKLLPKEFADDAVKMHCDAIQTFLKNPSDEKITIFENAVILLSDYGKCWNENQQKVLKEIAIPLVRFFIKDKLAEKMKGLLSENVMLRWYEDYGWTQDWGENEWKNFIKETAGISETEFYNFKSDFEFGFKLKLFIRFNKNAYIRELFVPLAIRILQGDHNEHTAAIVPRSLDDDFTTPILHFNDDVLYFMHTIEIGDVKISELISIINSYPIKNRNYNSDFQAEEFYKKIQQAFTKKLCDISASDIPELYKMLIDDIETDSGLYLSEFNEYINLLNDKRKKDLFELLLVDLKQNESWQKQSRLGRTVVLLLNFSNDDKQQAVELFEKLKEIVPIYNECIAELYNNFKAHPLLEIANKEYPVLFPTDVKRQQERNERINRFQAEKNAMLKEEAAIISNKEKLMNAINAIFEYLDANKDSLDEDADRKKLLDLQIDYIGDRIQYDYENTYSEPKIFSNFAVKVLLNNTGSDKRPNRKAMVDYISRWFSDEKYFWRYFFWLYMCHYKREETDTFLNENPHIVKRIKDSMRQEVPCILEKQDVSVYDGAQNRRWVVPFVYYLTRFYNDELPKWFDKTKILNFVAYPAWQLSTGFSVHINSEFKWENWFSVFEWIEQISGINEDVLIEKALALLPILKSDQSQSQIIYIFVDKVKSNSVFKQQMLNAIVDKTIIEIKKDYKTYSERSIMNGDILSVFWRETKENLVDKIFISIDFEKYNPKDINDCRQSVLEYFCRMATKEQKKSVINAFKKQINNQNIRVYLAKLGYVKAINQSIDKFLTGEKLDIDLNFYNSLFGESEKKTSTLRKFCQLYRYSLEKNNDRRQYLRGIARTGILETTSKYNYWMAKRMLNKIIKERKEQGLYYEGIVDFLNEIEQRVFGE